MKVKDAMRKGATFVEQATATNEIAKRMREIGGGSGSAR